MLSHPVPINIKSSKKKLTNILQNYYLYNFDEAFDKNEENEKQIIIQRITDSKLVIIDQFIYDDKSDIYLVIGFHKTIIIVKDSLIQLFQPLFANNTQLKFYFLHDSKDIFDTNSDIGKYQLFQYSDYLDEEIINFMEIIKINHPREDQIFQMQKPIKSCISGYLIGESYFKLIEEQKIDFTTGFNKESNQKDGEKSKIKEWTEDEYIKIRHLGITQFFIVELIYQIETGRLFAAKKANSIDEDIPKLNKREYENYLEINYPLLPKFYGIQNEDNCLIIQYIHGQTLDKIDITKLTLEDKITIMFELMLIIDYFRKKEFVYRDLKPNNIIMDANKTIFLIDFDRMINLNSTQIEFENITTDFQSKFAAPEVNNGEISYKNDIYSLGMMMKYLDLTKENDKINSLYLKCINCKASQRPFIFELLCQFYSIFSQNFNKTFFINISEFQFFLGVIYYEGKYITRDINKSIHYYSLAAHQNHPGAQNNLGFIYYEGENITQNINKAIYYFTLAANQNDPSAQSSLGYIYYKSEYISRDINKSIYYLTLAANQNDQEAQNTLGFIYYEGKYITRDINKSIYYYSLAANQNDPSAQSSLGAIYYEGVYISRDINKSIQYFTLAANQNHPDSQFALGNIYYEGVYISRDINKSIQYFTLAANQNHLDAQFSLGNIYYEGKYISRDINKSIYYYSLAANQNYSYAQNKLGFIYYEGKYITRDINKSIYYFTLAANQNHLGSQCSLGNIYYEGKYISRDINKSIQYLSLAANQNQPDSQNALGFIYYEGKYISRDINKSIYYYSLAANQNYSYAQFSLGNIYYEGKYITRDINKAIHYYSLAANQNHPGAQNELGFIYYEGKYITRDINKSIYYFTLAANQNDPSAQSSLGAIYYEGVYISRDINKSIQYFTLAANQNKSNAQFALGNIYLAGIYYKKNILKAIDYFIQSASNGNIDGHFVVGYFYHEGKHVERDIEKSIHHYKEASTFDNQYAKNNLGIIYRYGCGNEIQPNCGKSMAYFEEAIQRFQDKVSMYNLAHIYIYEDKNKDRLKKSIELLIESIKLDFSPSIELLCIAFIKLFGFNIEIIHEELNKLTNKSSKLSELLNRMIIYKKLFYKPIYEQYYKSLNTINYLYDFNEDIISTKIFFEPNPVPTVKITCLNITHEFYEGFGNDLQQHNK